MSTCVLPAPDEVQTSAGAGLGIFVVEFFSMCSIVSSHGKQAFELSKQDHRAFAVSSDVSQSRI